MQKKSIAGRKLLSYSPWLKRLLIMKMIAILLLVVGLTTSYAESDAQTAKVNLKFNTGTVKDVIEEIEHQTNLSFMYDNDVFKVNRQISIEVENETLKSVVDKLISGENLKYEMVNRFIVITSAKEPPVSQQGKKVTGKVTDSSGASLPGVSVVVKGTATGVITDIKGNYSVANIPENATLQFSFVGMKTQETAIGNKTSVNVIMEDETLGVAEVIVTALGIKRETKSIGYSIQSIPAKALESSADINLINSLSGKVAGVQINQSAGGADGSSSIVIRGQSSLLGNNQPLFVIDGIMIDNNQVNASDNGFDYGNGISDLNAADFESISILKGPNAAALYGARAANGVIIIVSKKGNKSKGLGVTLSSSMSWENPYQLKKFQNTYGAGESQLWEDYPQKDGVPVLNVTWNNFGPKMDGHEVVGYTGAVKKYLPQPNNIIDFYQPGFSATNNIALAGGDEEGLSTYRLSFSSREKKGVVPMNRADKYNVTFNGTQKLNDRISANIDVNYINSYGNGRPRVGNSGNSWDYHSSFFPRDISSDMYRDNYKRPDNSKQSAYPWGYNNAYWELYENKNTDESNRFIGGVELKFVLTNWMKLSLKTNTDTESRKFETTESGIRPGGAGGSYNVNQENSRKLTYEFLLSADRKLNSNLNLSLNFGGQCWDSKGSSIGGRTDGDLQMPNFFALGNSSLSPIANSYKYEKKINSIYGFGQLAFKDYLFLDFTARNDWSSTLAANRNSYFYPSLSAGFVFSDALGIGKSILDFGKIRASWAQVGKDTDPYNLYSTYGAGIPYGSYPTVNTPTTALLPDLKPEITSSFEIGGNLVFAGNRINMDFSYYSSSSRNQILPLPVAISSGVSSTLVNAGEIQNKGFELMLNVTPIKLKNFKWDVTYNFSRNRNKVVKLADGIETLEVRRNGDGPVIIEARPGEAYGNILIQGIKRTTDGTPVINKDGQYILTGKFEIAGNIQPDWTGGLTNDFRYKNWNIHTLIDFNMGGEIYSYSTRWLTARGSSEQSLFGRDKEHGGLEWIDAKGRTRNDGIIVEGVTEAGAPNAKMIEAKDYYNQSYQNDFASHIQSASYIMLREVSVSYKLPERWLERIEFIKSASLTLEGRNLGYLKNASKILNSTATAYGSSNGSKGIESGSLPASRVWGFNINVKF